MVRHILHIAFLVRARRNASTEVIVDRKLNVLDSLGRVPAFALDRLMAALVTRALRLRLPQYLPMQKIHI